MSDTTERFRQAVSAAATGSIAGLAVRAGLPRDAIRNVLSGHDPRLSRAADIACALGLSFHIGTPRPQLAESDETHNDRDGDVPGDASARAEAGEAASANRREAESAEPGAADDRRLSECLLVLRSHYEALGGGYARRHFVEDLLRAGGSGVRAQSARLVEKVWSKAHPIPGRDPDRWRTDDFGHAIKRDDHEKEASTHGWHIEFIVPFRRGGSDDLSNMRPRHCGSRR